MVADKPFPMHEIQKMYSFSASPDVQWNGKDSDNQNSLLLNLPEQQESINKFFYFEITIASGVACIGLQPIESIITRPDQNNSSSPSKRTDMIPTIGFSSDGNIHVSGRSMAVNEDNRNQTEEEHDWETIGCAWQIGGSNRVIFTRNGEIIDSNNSIETSFSSNKMFPAVSLQIDGTTVVANFGENPFVYTGDTNIELIGIQSSLALSKKHVPIRDFRIKTMEVVSSDSRYRARVNSQSFQDDDYTKAWENSMKINSTMDIITNEEIEESKDIARDLRSLNSGHDPDVISSMEEMVRTALQKIQYTLEYVNKFDSVGMDIMSLIDLNEFLIGALETSKRTRKPSVTVLQSTTSSSQDGIVVDKEHSSTEPKSDESEVPNLVHNKDIFSLICMLRSHTGDRLEAATALMG